MGRATPPASTGVPKSKQILQRQGEGRTGALPALRPRGWLTLEELRKVAPKAKLGGSGERSIC